MSEKIIAEDVNMFAKKRNNMEDNYLRIHCLYCDKEFAHLGSHLWHKHKVLARQYKEEFELDYKFALISPAVHDKKVKAFNEDREYYLSNFRKWGKKWYFKKGHTNRQRFSGQTLERARQNLEFINKTKAGQCPVCKIKFEHMTSHLYNKHGLQFAEK